MIAMVSLVYHGVLDRFPGLRICFLEGGAAWIALLLDQAARDEAFFGVSDAKYPLHHYLTNGQLLVGCEGEDPSLPYVASPGRHRGLRLLFRLSARGGPAGAKHEIEETLEHPELSQEQKPAVLGGNARRFFRL